MIRRAILVLGLMVSHGCAATGLGSELIVEVKTDLVPGVEFQHVRTEITVELADPQPPIVVNQTVDADQNFMEGVRVGEFQQLSSRDITVRVTLLDSMQRVVAERPTRVTLTKRLGLSVLISRDCRDVTCPLPEGNPALSACLAGQCVDARCHPEAPEFCGSAFECALDTECVSAVDCVVGQCVDAVCFFAGNNQDCLSTQMCHPDNGCVPEANEVPTCQDNLKNQDETDVDCGGACGANCALGDNCADSLDCSEGYCNSAAKCAPTSTGWSVAFAGSGFEIVYGVAKDGGDNLYIAGYYSATMQVGGVTYPATGTQNAILAKFDAHGNHQWSLNLAAASSSIRPFALAVTEQGNIYVTGDYDSASGIDFGGGPLVSAGSTDIFVAAYDTNGGFRWAKSFGSGSTEIGEDIALDSQGNVYLVAECGGSVNFGGGALPISSDALVSFDSDGNFRWQRAVTTSMMNALGVGGPDTVCITGLMAAATDFGGGTLSHSGTADMFAACYESNGDHRWSDSYPGNTLTDTGEDIAVDSLGNVVLLGLTRSTNLDMGGGPLTAIGNWDLVLAGFTPNGVHRWSAIYGSGADEAARSVSIGTNNEIWIAGTMQAAADLGGGMLGYAGAQDGFIARYDTEGVHLSSQGYGSTMSDSVDGLMPVGPAGVAAVGTFIGTVDLGYGPHTSINMHDTFLVRVEP